MSRALLAVGIGLVIVVVVAGVLPGIADGPSARAAAGPDTPVPVGALGSVLLGMIGLGALLWRDR